MVYKSVNRGKCGRFVKCQSYHFVDGENWESFLGGLFVSKLPIVPRITDQELEQALACSFRRSDTVGEQRESEEWGVNKRRGLVIVAFCHSLTFR